MQNELIESRIQRAKELLGTLRHAAMATVNEDGSPHNTPYLFMIDNNLENLYWGSHPESQHSQNITRTGKVFIVLYEAKESGGLYIEADQAHELSGDELSTALTVHNSLRAKANKPAINIEYYTEGLQRMYAAKPTRFWVNYSEKDENGFVLRDYRQEIKREQLL